MERKSLNIVGFDKLIFRNLMRFSFPQKRLRELIRQK